MPLRMDVKVSLSLSPLRLDATSAQMPPMYGGHQLEF